MRIAIIVATCLLLAGCMVQRGNDAEEIEATIHRLNQGLLEKDMSKIASAYASSFRWDVGTYKDPFTGEERPMYLDKAEMLCAWATRFDNGGNPGYIFDTFRHTFTSDKRHAVTRASGPTSALPNHATIAEYTFLMVREGGKWLIQDHDLMQSHRDRPVGTMGVSTSYRDKWCVDLS